MKTKTLVEALQEKLVKIATVLLCAMVIGLSFSSEVIMKLFYSPIASADNVNYTRVADPSTMETYLNSDVLGIAQSSRYAGRIWTDKTVFALGNSDSRFDGTTLSLDRNDDGSTDQISVNTDFLHVFSAIGSSQVVNQQASKPLDVILLLDISTSMTNSSQNGNDSLHEVINEANLLISQLMGDDPAIHVHKDNRVGVVVYGGGAQEILPLGHYQSSKNRTYMEISATTAKDTKAYFSQIRTTVEGGYSKTSEYMFADATYLQGALAVGMKMLAEEKNTTYYDELTRKEEPRTPVLIVLTDGATNIVSATSTSGGGRTSYNWWDPMTGVIATNSADERYAAAGGNPFYTDCNPDTGHGSSNSGRNSVKNRNLEIQAISPRTISNLLLAGYYKNKIQAHYNTSMLGFSIGYNVGGVGDYATEQLLATMDPRTYFGSRSNVLPLAQAEITETRNALEHYINNENVTMRFPRDPNEHHIWLNNDYANFTWNHLSGDEKQYDITSFDQLYYINKYYTANSGDLNSIFDEIFEQINTSTFNPISGSNDIGVDDSLTYMDPIGKYMEIKNEGVSVNDQKYDMSLLLFEEMHGLVKSAIYDYSFSSTHLKNGSFQPGWYDKEGNFKGDGETDGKWEDGDIYYLDIGTTRKYISTLSEDETHLTDKERHTVYTIYRFAEDTVSRNEDVINPCYELASNTTYKLSDIRVWIEDTGDYTDEDTGSAVNLGYNQALYINIPTNALPIQTANISIKTDGTIDYETAVNYRINKPDSKSNHVTPIRLFYGVGVDSSIMSDDGMDIEISKVPLEYVSSHTASDGVYFLSNYYSNTVYSGYVTDDYNGDRTRGDPNATFSPSEDNRYYVFQKPLVLYKSDVESYEEIPLDGDDYEEFIHSHEEDMVDDISDLDSNAYYYIVLDYYTNRDSQGIESHVAVSRKGSEFGSAFAATNGDLEVGYGEYLVWYNLANPDAPFSENTKNFSTTKPDEDGTWVIATKPGGLRTGDMAQRLLAKTENRTSTSYNVNIPIVGNSTSSENITIDNYLGNNGRIVIPDRLLEITKEVEAVGGENKADENFAFEVWIENYVGDHNAIDLIKNPYSNRWQLRIESIDVLTNNQGLLQTGSDENRELAVYQIGNDRYYVYIGANVSEGDADVYHLYSASDSEEHLQLRGVGRTTYVSDTTGLPTTGNIKYSQASGLNTVGSMDFWIQTVYLIPVKEVDVSWTWDASRASQYRTRSEFVISHIDSMRRGDAQISSNYSTRTNYLTKRLVFGYSNKDEIPEQRPEGWSEEEWDWARDIEHNANKARFTLQAGEGLGFLGLDDHIDYHVTEMLTQDQLDEGYTFDRVLDEDNQQSEVTSDGNNHTVSGVVDDLVGEHFINHYRARYDLTLKKTVRGADGDLTKDWTFHIRLTPVDGETIPTEYSYDGSKEGQLQFEEKDGYYEATITLKHNESITIHNLISNTTYEIIEEGANEDGYTTVVTDDNNTGIVDEDETIEFVNTNLSEHDLTIRKTVTGNAGEQEREWIFDITLIPQEGVTLADHYQTTGSKGLGEMTLTPKGDGSYLGTVSIKHNETITIQDLPEGTRYQVVERGANQDGYETTITGETEGVLENHLQIEISYVNNRYSRHQLEIKKIVDGMAGDVNKYWTFEITFIPSDDVKFETEYPYTGGHSIEGVEDPQDSVLKLVDQKDGTYTGSITLRHGQTITIRNIPERTQYSVVEKEANSDRYMTESTNSTGELVDPKTTVTFKNTKWSRHNLRIEKEVVDLTEGDFDFTKDWTFEITLIPANGISLEDSYPYVGESTIPGVEPPKDGTLQLTNNHDGSYTATITLKHGQAITIQDLPERTKYSVTEQEANQDGYLAHSTDNRSGIVTAETTTIKYTNTKLPNQTLTIAKEVSGNDGDLLKEWTFYIHLQPKDGETLLENYPYKGMTTLDGVEAPEDAEMTFEPQEDGSVLGIITLKHGQGITLYNLPVGTIYGVEEVEANQEDYMTKVSASTSGTILEDAAAILVFDNHKISEVDLTISKIVAGLAGDKEKEWNFVITFTPAEYVTLKDSYEYTGTRSGTLSLTSNGDGSYRGTIQLKHRDKITIQGLPEETLYKIVELEADQDGYITTFDGRTIGRLTAEGTEVSFTNTKLGKTNLTIQKFVKGNLGEKERLWHFHITLIQPKVVELADTYSYQKTTIVDGKTVEQGTLSLTKNAVGNYEAEVLLKDGEAITLLDLPEGTKYIVEEVEANQDGYVTSYTDNTVGELYDETPTVTFTNWKYTNRNLVLEKQLKGNGTEKNKEWNFEIIITPEEGYPLLEQYPYQGFGKEDGFIEFIKMEDGSYHGTVQLKGGQKILLENLPYEATYEVIEKEANKNHYQTTATNDTGTLVEETTEVLFVNERDIENPHTLDEGSKYMMMLIMSIIVMISTIFYYKKQEGSSEN